MSWRTKKSTCNRLASIAAMLLVPAFSANAANAGTESGEFAVNAETKTGDTAAAGVPASDRSAGDTATGEVAKAGDPAAMPSSESPTNPASPAPGRVRAGGTLQHRVDVLSKALQLDARQRTQLLTILESQRQAVSNIWSDPKLLPSERTPATRALQERTANQIRAILTDEQRKLYNPPKPQGAEPPPPPNVEEWMRKQSQTQARQQP
jgi:hypothetical protein